MPNFLAKVYEIVDASGRCKADQEAHIYWNPAGKGFIVDKPNKFSEEVLPHYFKTNQFSSFVR